MNVHTNACQVCNPTNAIVSFYIGRKSIAMLAFMAWWGYSVENVQEFLQFMYFMRGRAAKGTGFAPRHYESRPCASCRTELSIAVAWKVSI
jgi:hypothetical protein